MVSFPVRTEEVLVKQGNVTRPESLDIWVPVGLTMAALAMTVLLGVAAYVGWKLYRDWGACTRKQRRILGFLLVGVWSSIGLCVVELVQFSGRGIPYLVCSYLLVSYPLLYGISLFCTYQILLSRAETTSRAIFAGQSKVATVLVWTSKVMTYLTLAAFVVATPFSSGSTYFNPGFCAVSTQKTFTLMVTFFTIVTTVLLLAAFLYPLLTYIRSNKGSSRIETARYSRMVKIHLVASLIAMTMTVLFLITATVTTLQVRSCSTDMYLTIVAHMIWDLELLSNCFVNLIILSRLWIVKSAHPSLYRYLNRSYPEGFEPRPSSKSTRGENVNRPHSSWRQSGARKSMSTFFSSSFINLKKAGSQNTENDGNMVHENADSRDNIAII